MVLHRWKLERSENTSYICTLCGAKEHVFVDIFVDGQMKTIPGFVLEHCEEETIRLVLEE